MPVPEGYTVKGLESLNKTVDNVCGSLVTTATMEGANLVIDVRKVYKGGHFESGQWKQLVDVMDAAYNFSQAKVILKKN